MSKVICVLYDDSVTFTPSTLQGSVAGELGLREYLESSGHQLVVTSSRDGANSVLDRELPDAEILISQPFWPAYMTAERFAKARKLKLVVTAGIGSDHTDLRAAMDKGVTVWFPQPPSKDHPWRTMTHHCMTAHIAGTSVHAQTRYAAGTREILECYFGNRPIRDEYLIVQGGKFAGVGAHSYSASDATSGAEESVRLKTA